MNPLIFLNSELHPVHLFYLYLVLMNTISFFTMALDKWAAIHQHSRISEQQLLAIGFFGGGLGGLLGMLIFCHKTRKTYFKVVYLAGIGFFIWIYHQFFASVF